MSNFEDCGAELTFADLGEPLYLPCRGTVGRCDKMRHSILRCDRDLSAEEYE